MKSAFLVLKEQLKHFYLIRRLSLYEIKSENKNNYLGMVWEIINPSIQIMIYWFVFSSIRHREPIDMNGQMVPFFPWLVAGFFLWFFIYQSIIKGSSSIYSRLKMLSKMNFPMSVIPNFVIFSNLYVHLVMLVISIGILNAMGYIASIYYLQIIYTIFATICLVFAIALITSTLSTIMRDFHMLLNSSVRMLLYLSGVLWPITLLEDFPLLMKIMMLNPIYYLLQSYRAALFGSEWYLVTHWEYTIVFWGIVIVLFLIGSMLHTKFRRHFIDYL